MPQGCECHAAQKEDCDCNHMATPLTHGHPLPPSSRVRTSAYLSCRSAAHCSHPHPMSRMSNEFISPDNDYYLDDNDTSYNGYKSYLSENASEVVRACANGQTLMELC